MANATINLSLTTSGYVDRSRPYTVITTNTSTEYEITENSKLMYFGMEKMPNALKHNVLISVSMTIACKGHARLYFEASKGEFNPTTLTYNNRPGTYVEYSPSVGPDSDTIVNTTADASTNATYISRLFAHNTVAVRSNSSSVLIPTIKTVLTNGSTRPYFTISYDDTAKVTSKIVYKSGPASGEFNPSSAATFQWAYEKNGSASCADETWTQASAKLYWKKSTASSWNQISISGTTLSVTVPANTFPTGATVQWYLQGTDTDGTTTTTTTYSFTTPSSQITPDSYPSGSNIDNRLARTFTWHFQSSAGNYQQGSATFHWRKQGTTTWNNINASGATQSVSVPAYTFPAATTIEWYLSGTDFGGTSSTSQTKTFSTVTPKIAATIYPSGSNVFSGENLTFQWHISSAAGDHDQSSAIFYWRASTSDPYTSVSVSGNTQQVTIPANTFPTNSTIYWYLSGTERSGYVSTTSVANFKTQTTKITPQNSPTSGYANPRNAITFSWYFAADSGSVPQQSATFYWRESGGSSYTSVAASGSTTSVTILANTFPIASVIEWYISGTDVGGTSSTSTVYSFSTTASTAVARVKSPINSGVDGSAPITFVWTLSSADGFPASRVILEWKLPLEDDQHWHTIVDANEAITQYTVAADTFSSGEINWRVRAYNVDAVEGPESTASFICMVAPIVTALAASPVPFSVITWQANDQEAFQLEVDGKLYGTYFGQEKEFVMPDYFRDGIHDIRVRVLGKVELWSEWAETTVSIQNVPGANVELEGLAGVDVELEWETSNAEVDFLIYRDGILIGHTENKRFVDRFSLGRHDYAVVNRLSSGNYSISETISRKTCVEYLHIETPDGSEAVSVRFRLKGRANPEHQFSRDVNLNKLDGHEYPSLTLSNFRSHSVRLSAVFLYTEGNKWEKFQRLLGKAVIVKINDGTCCAAIIDSWNRTVDKTYYTAYEFSIRQIDWEDYDDTQ